MTRNTYNNKSKTLNVNRIYVNDKFYVDSDWVTGVIKKNGPPDSEYLKKWVDNAVERLVDSDFVMNLVADSEWVMRQIRGNRTDSEWIIRNFTERADSDWVIRTIKELDVDSDWILKQIALNKLDSDWVIRTIKRLDVDSDWILKQIALNKLDSEWVSDRLDSEYVRVNARFLRLDSDVAAINAIASPAGRVDSEWVIRRIRGEKTDSDWVLRQIKRLDVDSDWINRQIALNREKADSDWVIRTIKALDVDSDWILRTIRGNRTDSEWIIRRFTEKADSDWVIRTIKRLDVDSDWIIRTIKALDVDSDWILRTIRGNRTDSEWVLRQIKRLDVDSDWIINRINNASKPQADSDWILRQVTKSEADSDWINRQIPKVEADSDWIKRYVKGNGTDSEWVLRQVSKSEADSDWIQRNAVKVTSTTPSTGNVLVYDSTATNQFGGSGAYRPSGYSRVTMTVGTVSLNIDPTGSNVSFKNSNNYGFEINETGNETIVRANADSLKINGSTGVTTVTTNFVPSLTNSKDLGTTSLRWKSANVVDLDVSGNAILGANSVSTVTFNATPTFNTEVTFDGVVIVESGEIKTVSQTTALVFDEVVTDGALFGAATNVTIGAATGVTTINHDLIVTGDLTINGTTTTVNAANLAVTDQLITLNNGGTAASANGGGITLDGAGASITYSTGSDSWTFNKNLSGATIDNDLTVNGNTVLGDSSSDRIQINGTIDTNVIPNGNQNLGALTDRWGTLYAQSIDVDGDTTLGDTSSDNLTVNATPTFKENSKFEKNLNVDGNVVLGSSLLDDTTTFQSRITSHVVPMTTGMYNIGETIRRWGYVYATNIDVSTELKIGNWTIVEDGGDLQFQVGGTAVFKITSTGAIIAADDITAFGTP